MEERNGRGYCVSQRVGWGAGGPPGVIGAWTGPTLFHVCGRLGTGHATIDFYRVMASEWRHLPSFCQPHIAKYNGNQCDCLKLSPWTKQVRYGWGSFANQVTVVIMLAVSPICSTRILAAVILNVTQW